MTIRLSIDRFEGDKTQMAAHPEHFLTYRRDEAEAAAIARRHRLPFLFVPERTLIAIAVNNAEP